MKKKYITNSSTETKKLGERFAKEILKAQFKKQAFIIGLEGELGSGKTTFLQGFAKGLGIKEKILSPTFVILKKFQVFHPPKFSKKTWAGKSYKFQEFYHIDCYRIKKSKEILDLGFKEIISNPENIVVIEWADRMRKIIPKNTIWLKFEFVDEKKRKITIKQCLN